MQKTFQHTPGPWTAKDTRFANGHGSISLRATSPEDKNIWVADAQGSHVGPRSKKECEANARLIAAAPELLEALKVALKEIAAWRSGHNTKAGLKNANLAKAGCCYGGLSQAKSAIEKATIPNT